MTLVPSDLSLLEAMEAATDANSSVRAVEGILQGKRVNALREDPRFARALESLVAISAAAEPRALLSVVAALYRLGSASKPVMKLVETCTASLLSQPLPPVDLLESGEDRFYVALAVTANKRDWCPAYAAHAIAAEDTAEKARKAFADGLANWTDLSSLIRKVASELARVQYTTEKPAESAARRIARVIAAIRPALIAAPMEAGEDLGSALESLFRAALDVSTPEEGSPASEKAASECCGLVYDVLRTQIEVVADAAVYRSLERVARWTSVGLWPRFVRGDANARGVLTSLERAIILLARRGTTDADLLNLMQFFLGPRDVAAKRAAAIAESRPDLAPEVREWLSRFGRIRDTARLASMEDARDVGADLAIASTLVSAWEVKCQIADGKEDSLPPGTRRLLSSVEQLARSRGLALKLAPGDVVEYSSRSHELLGGTHMGVRHVTVVTPMVEKMSSNGAPAVVLRAIVKI